MYSQYTNKIETEVGTLSIEYTIKTVKGVSALDSMLVIVNGRVIDCPKSWYKQTSQTIARKVCALLKAA